MSEPRRQTDGLFLIKYGEIALKRRNRGAFVKSLKDSIRAHLPDLPFSVHETFHRVFVGFRPEDKDRIAEALGRTFGVVSFCEALRAPREMPAIEEAAIGLAGRLIETGTRFKAEVRRADKSFPLTSYEIACRIGDTLRARFPGFDRGRAYP